MNEINEKVPYFPVPAFCAAFRFCRLRRRFSGEEYPLLFFRVRSPLYLLIFPSVISLAVYTVFYKILIVPLPEGIFSF